jgi:hypothetical protein
MTTTEPNPMTTTDDRTDYQAFLEAKAQLATTSGLDVDPSEVHPALKPHQRDTVVWAVRGGRRAIFANFGLGKTLIQLETIRLVLTKLGRGRGLIVLPLGVRQEFTRDAQLLGLTVHFIRTIDEATEDGIYTTNYETVRDGRLDPRDFDVISLDEAAILRGLGGTKTFRELMRLYEGTAGYRFVATATPSPNEYIELLAYAAFLDVMDVGQAKTRFFKRDSTKADKLTLHPHMEREFWLWVASWALFLQKPSDLGHSDEGYELPPLDVRWHEIPSGEVEEFDRHGRGALWRNAALGVQQAAAEKRDSLPARVTKMRELVAATPGEHFLLWHDLEAERHAIEAALPEAVTVWGSQDLDERERRIIDFSDGKIRLLATKPVIAGSGCNFQRHCHRAIFVGIGFKFADFIQAVHRIHRFLQDQPVRIDLIYTEAERDVRASLERKWIAHDEMTARMGEIIRTYGLSHEAMTQTLARSIGVHRQEAKGENYRLVNADAVEETQRMDSDSVDLIVTSIPFATQYEYTPSYNDFGHTDDNAHFWAQMDYLTPELLRVLAPGRVAAIHVKDRVAPGGITGLGFQTVQPFHAEAITHYMRHGFAFLGMKTIVTDVVRENNQTYRLGWTEQCKDGSKMGAGLPEYVLLFRKPPTDASNGYADLPVVKDKKTYSRARWQVDAHGFTRSNGDRPLLPEEIAELPADQVFKLFRDHNLTHVYDYEKHVELGETLEARRRLPSGFMLLQPPSWHPDVWTDVARMRTLNMLQERKGQQFHLCLARGSLVLTRGGYKPIQEVQVGEHVLTHKGRWRPVLAVQNTGVRPAVNLRAQGVPGLVLTPDHKVWARKSNWVRERDGAERAEPGWLPASEAVGGYVNLKLPPAETPAVTDPGHWWAVGRWLADGHLDTHGGAIISCGVHEIDDLVSKLGRFAGNPAHRNGTAAQILLRDRDQELRRTLKACGTGAAGKHLPPEAYTLPVEQARALLDGYLSGDGHYRTDRRRWMATSVSKELLLGIAMLAQRVHGAIASVYPGRPPRECTIQGRTVQTRQDWILSFNVPGGDRRKQEFVLTDGAWKKVRSADPVGEVETWNLRVAEDESYTAEGAIVKNCPLQFDIVDRLIVQYSMPGETVLDPFGGLMTVPYCALKLDRRGIGIELNPRYFADGVAYVEGVAREARTPTLFDLVALEDEADGVSA